VLIKHAEVIREFPVSHNILRIHVARSRHIILAERSAARLALWNLHPVLSRSRRRPGRFLPPEPYHDQFNDDESSAFEALHDAQCLPALARR
jgi:hypothetical protein